MSAVFDVRARLEEMGLQPKKALGQNFLINLHVIERIVAAALAQPHADLVEIGPGLGALTEPIVKRGARPKLIELDSDLAVYWRQRGFEVVEGDALKVNWTALDLQKPTTLVSNLPYQISSSLVIEHCFGPENIRYMVLMFQKEVAERLLALPRTKDYGLLSVLAQLHFRMRRVVDAGPGDFFPAPKVASRVLSFERLENVQLGAPFLRFVKQAFAFRRKYLLKNIKGVVDKSIVERLPELFAELSLGAKVRAEELSPEQFVLLFKKIHEHKNHN